MYYNIWETGRMICLIAFSVKHCYFWESGSFSQCHHIKLDLVRSGNPYLLWHLTCSIQLKNSSVLACLPLLGLGGKDLIKPICGPDIRLLELSIDRRSAFMIYMQSTQFNGYEIMKPLVLLTIPKQLCLPLGFWSQAKKEGSLVNFYNRLNRWINSYLCCVLFGKQKNSSCLYNSATSWLWFVCHVQAQRTASNRPKKSQTPVQYWICLTLLTTLIEKKLGYCVNIKKAMQPFVKELYLTPNSLTKHARAHGVSYNHEFDKEVNRNLTLLLNDLSRKPLWYPITITCYQRTKSTKIISTILHLVS